MVLILLFTFFQFYSVVSRDSKVDKLQVLFFCWLLKGLVFWPKLGDPFVCQSPRKIYVYRSLRQILGSAYTICLYGQISISCTSTSESSSPPSRIIIIIIIFQCEFFPPVQIDVFSLVSDW